MTYSRRSREGVVNLLKKGDKADPGNYRGVTVLSTAGETFQKILNDITGTMIEKEEKKAKRKQGLGQTVAT